MKQLSDFVGTWHASEGAPFSNHTFTWTPSETGLQGRWVIEAPDSPTRIELQVGSPWLESDVLLFTMHGGPLISEFRLAGPDEAVVGAAVVKPPAEFAGPEHRRSIEGHRVRLIRQRETTA